MLKLLLVLFLLITACVAIHGAGMILAVRWIGRSWRREVASFGLTKTFWLLVRVVYSLLVLHTMQITVWAGVYLYLDCFPDFETSFYYSATSYSTVGYGDVVPPPEWRILGSMEAVTGVLMFGWSTGALLTVVQHVHAHFARPRDTQPA
jgi:voltage-gated potassium channel